MSIRLEGGRIDVDSLSPAARLAGKEVWDDRLESSYPLRGAVSNVAAVTAEFILGESKAGEVDALMDYLKMTIKRVEEEAEDLEKDEVISGTLAAMMVGVRAALNYKLRELRALDGTIAEGQSGF